MSGLHLSFYSDNSNVDATERYVDNIVAAVVQCQSSCVGSAPYEPTSPWITPAIQDFLQPFLQAIFVLMFGRKDYK